MNWYKIRAQDEAGEGYTYVGASPLTADAIAELASQGKFIRLESLLYMDRGDVKEWAEWDKSLIPVAYINPDHVFSFMQFHGDPRVTPRK